MSSLIEIVINLGIPLLLIILAMITGTLLERNHFKSIEKRENEYGKIPLLNSKKYPKDKPVVQTKLVNGSVVISYDYFKRFIAGIRMLFGGEVRSYVSLMDRGRREAILRMKESCNNPDAIINFRLATSSISKGKSNKSIGSVEVFAYGTAIWFAKD